MSTSNISMEEVNETTADSRLPGPFGVKFFLTVD